MFNMYAWMCKMFLNILIRIVNKEMHLITEVEYHPKNTTMYFLCLNKENTSIVKKV